ncbi:MAG: RNA-binding protein [Lentisphaeria bacterium]|jgi:RNA-binding protein
MALTNENKKKYRLIGHNLKPVVTIAGKGLNENVLAELERALDDHELIKVKVSIIDKEIRKQAIDEMCSSLNAEKVQEIGKVTLLFRASRKTSTKKSNVR